MTANEVYGVVMALDTKINYLQEENDRLRERVRTLEGVVESHLLKGVANAEGVHLNFRRDNDGINERE